MMVFDVQIGWFKGMRSNLSLDKWTGLRARWRLRGPSRGLSLLALLSHQNIMTSEPLYRVPILSLVPSFSFLFLFLNTGTQVAQATLELSV